MQRNQTTFVRPCIPFLSFAQQATSCCSRKLSLIEIDTRQRGPTFFFQLILKAGKLHPALFSPLNIMLRKPLPSCCHKTTAINRRKLRSLTANNSSDRQTDRDRDRLAAGMQRRRQWRAPGKRGHNAMCYSGKEKASYGRERELLL